MLIEVRLDPDALRLWQRHLVDEIASLPGVGIQITTLPGRIAWPRGMKTLLDLEDRIGGRPIGRASETIGFDTMRSLAQGSGTADLILDLTGSPAQAGDPPLLELRCNALPFETGAIAAVLSGGDALFETRLLEDGAATTLSRWRPATETPNRAGSALDMLFGRAADMLVHEVKRLLKGRPPALPPLAMPQLGAGSPGRFFLRSLEGRIRQKLARQLGRAPDWHVAIRQRLGDDGVPRIGPEGFRRLPDDGQRFYADPFLYEAGGETFLFVEEFPYATQKGILSVARVTEDGGTTRPSPVLEGPDHLSYPFVFAAEGAIWMIPETSARRRVELYRADPFPHRWTLHSVLIDDADLADATLLRREDGWWLFAASRARWTSSWDALSLYQADSLSGPWRPHPGNPVQVDLKSSRPGGRILELGNRLVRPTQDCAGGYGARLAFAEIEWLDGGSFEQRVVATARPWGPDTGLHHFDRTAAFEVIDLFGPR